MTPPLISIVLPTYNGARYLSSAIESCLRQSFSDWELIIVDDCSTDDTPSVIARYQSADERIRVVRHVQNSKLPAALNSGFAIATGELLTWTSDDNEYEPDALLRMSEFLREHPAIDVVYSDYLLIDEEGRSVGEMRALPPQALVATNAVGACFLYRRRVHDKLQGYDVNLFLAEDYDFWLRASVEFVLHPLHEPLYRYRRHSGSLTAQRKREIVERHIFALQRSLPRMKCIGSATRSSGWLNLAGMSWELGRRRDALRFTLRAFRSSPLIAILALGRIVWRGHGITHDRQLHIYDHRLVRWLDA